MREDKRYVVAFSVESYNVLADATTRAQLWCGEAQAIAKAVLKLMEGK